MVVEGDIEEAPGKESSKGRISVNDSTIIIDGSTSKNSNSISIAVPIDPAVLAMVSAVRDPDSDEDSEKRKSQLFCFVCCDLIKACIVMNAVHILISIIHVIISVLDAPIGFRIILYDTVDDDGLQTLNPWGVVGYIKMALGYIFAIVGMYGAADFRKDLVLCSAIWYCCYILLSLIGRHWSVFFISMPFCYTNFHCYLALRSGSITRENYETEKHCCCGGGGKDEYD
mmetsp:Transcript_1788/g.4163  ORF Transcript_1788/g.4163 Transcript_1788/m.4163 type:complete len:228 (-) Transcript_1788:457-1140(-)